MPPRNSFEASRIQKQKLFTDSLHDQSCILLIPSVIIYYKNVDIIRGIQNQKKLVNN